MVAPGTLNQVTGNRTDGGGVHSWDAEPVAEPLPGVCLRSLWLDAVMVTRVEMGPGVDVPDHAHASEQIGSVIAGTLRFRFDGAEHVLGPGDAYRVPGRARHGGHAGPEGCVVLEAFSPIRT